MQEMRLGCDWGGWQGASGRVRWGGLQVDSTTPTGVDVDDSLDAPVSQPPLTAAVGGKSNTVRAPATNFHPLSHGTAGAPPYCEALPYPHSLAWQLRSWHVRHPARHCHPHTQRLSSPPPGCHSLLYVRTGPSAPMRSSLTSDHPRHLPCTLTSSPWAEARAPR